MAMEVAVWVAARAVRAAVGGVMARMRAALKVVAGRGGRRRGRYEARLRMGCVMVFTVRPSDSSEGRSCSSPEPVSGGVAVGGGRGLDVHVGVGVAGVTLRVISDTSTFSGSEAAADETRVR